MRKTRLVDNRGDIFIALLFGLSMLLLFLGVGSGVFFREAIIHHVYTFPKEAAAYEELRAQCTAPTLDDGWNEYSGVCHSHSELSHDSNVPFTEILASLKEAKRDFILMSDHCNEGKADYSVQWEGVHDGVLFVPGYEIDANSQDGCMPWGLPRNTVLSCGQGPESLAKEVKSLGGLVFLSHCEEPHKWEMPEIDGMEIYNIHTDLKDENFVALIPDLILNYFTFPEVVLQHIYDPQDAIVARWDELNATRKIVGIAANDCHQNSGVIGTVSDDNKLVIADTSPKVVKEIELKGPVSLLLQALYGPLTPGRQLFHYQLDPYPRIARYVGTHILAQELSQDAILGSLKQGRVFVGFDMIADTKGFVFFADDGTKKAVMGETMPFGPNVHLRAAAPLPCHFKVIKNGEAVFEQDGAELDWTPTAPGKYRLEAWLSVLGKSRPWIYANPLELQ